MPLEDLDKRYENGRTLLHWAAYAGQLNQVPRKRFTLARLRRADYDGTRVIHAAAVGRCLDAIPTKLLDAALLNQRDQKWMTVWHLAARNSCLDQIPTHLYTDENLLLEAGEDGHTAFHEAAIYGSLDQIPAHLLTASNLTRFNAPGFTPLHYAARRLHQIPEAVLTKENLMLESRDGHGRPVIYKAASGVMKTGKDNRCFLCPEGFKDIPLPVLLTCKDIVLEGKTVLEHLSPEQRTSVNSMATVG